MESRRTGQATRQATVHRSAAIVPDAIMTKMTNPPEETKQTKATSPVTMSDNSTLVTRTCFAPIVRADEPRREVEVCATSETIDTHDTIFDYQASKDAFTRWIGIVRKMHERRAVGSRAAVRFDDQQRKVFVRVHISQGAEDTWQKILDGTLRGASSGASNVVCERQVRRSEGRERRLNVATRYDLVELSLVDNPSNPMRSA